MSKAFKCEWQDRKTTKWKKDGGFSVYVHVLRSVCAQVHVWERMCVCLCELSSCVARLAGGVCVK